MRALPRFHHQPLPDHSTLLVLPRSARTGDTLSGPCGAGQGVGRLPRDEFGFTSDRLQIWYNHTETGWVDSAPHAHQENDECFIMLHGQLLVEVDGERFLIGPREFCCFPRGVYHAIIQTYPPVESLMIRAPAVDDKHYQER